jgi:tRNA uridine 5-carboxymethylaminomethyl modification enzyme
VSLANSALENNMCSTWNNKFDVIVAGGGHAGIEASLCCARRGLKTALITLDIDTIGQMSCNPAIGGLGKGHLVRELDALGGEMARAIDSTGIQFRLLNKSKGPAVWSPRAQADKELYVLHMKNAILNQGNLDVISGMLVNFDIIDDNARTVTLSSGKNYECGALIICAGTFLNGLMHTGETKTAGGRLGAPAATGLTDSLNKYNIASARFKTGTPPRVLRSSIDFDSMEEQKGDDIPRPFRFYENLICQPVHSCYISYTNAETHKVLEENLKLSAMFSGQIESTGPRYCPSVEDKIVRFADKDRHQLFLEPESQCSDELYINGFSTSMPLSVQQKALSTIPGFENVIISRPGYAIEYDYFLPHQLDHRLCIDGLKNVFLAGQIVGTSGYEEAAVQGFVAACNACSVLDNDHNGLYLGRDESYIGVLLDDLVNKENFEPYRMFTSRAEFRLLLRQDNADERLMPIGQKLGTLESWRTKEFDKRREQKIAFNSWLSSEKIDPKGGSNKIRLIDLIKRPEVKLIELLQNQFPEKLEGLAEELLTGIEFDIKYAGYINRQQSAIENFRKSEGMLLPESIDYLSISTICIESRQILSRLKPKTIGQASRIAGIKPADINALLIFIKKSKFTKSNLGEV